MKLRKLSVIYFDNPEELKVKDKLRLESLKLLTIDFYIYSVYIIKIQIKCNLKFTINF